MHSNQTTTYKHRLEQLNKGIHETNTINIFDCPKQYVNRKEVGKGGFPGQQFIYLFIYLSSAPSYLIDRSSAYSLKEK